MPATLTETAIRAAIRRAKDGERVELADSAFRGLRLRIGTAGKAKWVLACRDQGGRMRRFEVGAWPSMGIGDARREAETLRVAVRKGADPTADKRRQRSQARDANVGIGTLEALIKRYGEKVGAKKKSWAESKRRIELVFKDHLNRPLGAITRQELQASIDDYPAAQQARGATTALTPILGWAEKRGAVPHEVLRIEPPAKSEARERVLKQAEIKALLPVLRGSSSGYAAALQLILLTLARRSEAGGATWSELDLENRLWVIPKERSKNGVEHRIRLSHQAVEMLKARGPGQPYELVFSTRTGGRLTNWDRATKVIMKASGTKEWTRHDLRRTGATMLGRMGVLPHVIEAGLNHVHIESQVATIYNQARYEPEVGAALQKLADALDRIEAGGAQVVPLRAGPAA